LGGILPKYSPTSGGALLAIVGGDGAGKSTAVDALDAWLSQEFRVTRVHMGKPAWSRTTRAVRAILKAGSLLGLYPAESTFHQTLGQKSLVSPAYPWLLREVCRARDRYWTYVRARRFAAAGGLVILDRFPHPLIGIMDGPQVDRFVGHLAERMTGDEMTTLRRIRRLARWLVRWEEHYYRPIGSPEALVVLRLDPAVAVGRKTDEDANSVRERSQAIWETDWEPTEAHVIDSSGTKADVLTELKTLVWSKL
jgi:thymidylate kinase